MNYKLISILIILNFVFFLNTKAQYWEINRQTEGQERLMAVSFPDSINGWMVGNRPGESSEYIIYTNNGGESWSEQTSAVNSNGELRDVYFTDSLTGFVLGSQFIQKTVDGGKNWLKIENDSMANNSPAFVDFDFVDNNAWAIGDAGRLFKSTDGGNSWEEKMSLGIYATEFTSIDFVNRNVGIAVGFKDTDTGIVLRTTDGGESWTNMNVVTRLGGGFYKVFFANDTVVYVVGIAGSVVRSDDAGLNWQEKTNIESRGSYLVNTSLYFQNANTGWVGGQIKSREIMRIYRTNDGGESWQEEYKFTNVGMYFEDIIFSENVDGWACANITQTGSNKAGSIILKRDNDVSTAIKTEQNYDQTVSFSGNIPNPFSGETKIVLKATERKEIQLKVYNATGQLIQVVYKGEIEPGTHSFNFVPSSKTDGLYVAVLRVDGQTITQKMTRTQ